MHFVCDCPHDFRFNFHIICDAMVLWCFCFSYMMLSRCSHKFFFVRSAYASRVKRGICVMLYIYTYIVWFSIMSVQSLFGQYGFVCIFHVLDVIVRQRGHNLRDLPSILIPGRSCRHILRTKWEFAPNIIWALTATQQQLWLSFNLVLSLSSISLLLSNQLSHASVLIVCSSPALSTTVTLPSSS
jgi:hypothetical protein